jgi:hypothetical protein
VSGEDRPRRASSFTRMAVISTTFQQSSMPVRVADGPASSWWHPVAAWAGSHHALHHTPAFGAATTVSTIDRTVARKHGTLLTLRQERSQGAPSQNHKSLGLRHAREPEADCMARFADVVPKIPQFTQSDSR